MEDFLVPVRSRKLIDEVTNPPKERSQSTSKEANFHDGRAEPFGIFERLRDEPDASSLLECLRVLNNSTDTAPNIHAPSPRLSQILAILANKTIPDFWPITKQSVSKQTSSIRAGLVRSFRTVSGVVAILNGIKGLIREAATKIGSKVNQSTTSNLACLLEVLKQSLNGNGFIAEVLGGLTNAVAIGAKRTVFERELIATLSSGRIIAIVAEAEDILKKADVTYTASSLAKGANYASWLGANIRCLSTLSSPERHSELAAFCAQLLSKSTFMGHTDTIIEAILLNPAHDVAESLTLFTPVTMLLPIHDKRKALHAILRALKKGFLQDSANQKKDADQPVNKTVGACAAFLRSIIQGDSAVQPLFADTLLNVVDSPLFGSPLTVRVSLLVIQDDEDALSEIFEKNLERFSEQVYIKHTPILMQEATAQIILLTAGYIHRSNPMALFTLARSSTHMQGITHRLAAPSRRAMWLGMIVGETISRKVDKPNLQMKFDIEEMKTPEADWYRRLVDVHDEFSNVSLLDKILKKRQVVNAIDLAMTVDKQRSREQRPEKASKKERPTSSILRIVEIEDDSDEEDLVPYSKPDSDPEDDDEDPTLVQRDKPKPPVYIRDLITGLNEKEKYDVHYIAISTASDLITRKADFGKEVKENAEELANILMGLQDSFEIDEFEDLRQRALVATLLSNPSVVAPYISAHFFEGDYSLQQRTAMLTALGLGARKLAGFDEGETSSQGKTSFPSKRLPPHLDALYSSLDKASNKVRRGTKAIDTASSALQTKILTPLALEAADSLTGPNALKVRTFSSRMAVEKARKKPIPNALAQTVAESFFYPLTGRWWAVVQHGGGSGGRGGLWTSTYLLPTFLRTLALIIHASGPSTLSLPQMTSEFWSLLFSVRNTALSERITPTLEAILFSFMVLLEVNEDKRRIATEQGNEIIETREWARLVMEKMGGGDEVRLTGLGSVGERRGQSDHEAEKVRMLAAGVIMRCNEVVEKWQRLMLGHMIEP